jgi:chloride channel protein, CIC family
MSSHNGTGLTDVDVKKRHILPKALLIGLSAGIVASTFRMALHWSEFNRISLIQRVSPINSLILSLSIGFIGGGLGLWLVRRFAPETSGSGIPHMKSVILGEEELHWYKVLPIKFIAGLSSIGGGLALGREGPTIQLGGATGMMVSKLFKVKAGEGERKALMSAGAAAGLSAAFNAPLAGLIFVLEELHNAFTPVIFVAAFLASVTADIVCRVTTGDTPVFELHGMPVPSLNALPVAVIVGIVAGFGGVFFNKSLIASLNIFYKINRYPAFLVGSIVGITIGFFAWLSPDLSGSGSSLAEHAISGKMVLSTILLFILGRFLMTMFSYGSGAAGGIFAPLLVIGALSGLAIGITAHNIIPTFATHPEIFAVLGMGAILTSVVRAPLTGIVLMVELTGKYDYMLPLLVSCFVAYLIAEALKNEPIYEALRERSKRLKGAK